ncbi:MAG: hypothetical protein SGILL_009980, partial [Bacillariaceae sp.]
MKCFPKFLSLGILALSSLEHSTAAAAPFVARYKAPTPETTSKKAIEYYANLPRGGGILGTPVEAKHLVTLYYSFYALNGATALPAPEASAGTFPELSMKGSTGYVVYEHLGAISLSYAALVYFAAKGNRSVPTAIAMSSLPLAYVRYKDLLSNLGKSSPASLLVAGLLIGGTFMILSGKGDATLCAQALALFNLASGAVGEINPDLGVKVWGFSTLKGSTKAFFIWFIALVAGYGALAAMMLQGRSGMEAIGYAALLETVFMIDCIYLRKWNVGVAPPESNYIFLGIPLITALAILLT